MRRLLHATVLLPAATAALLAACASGGSTGEKLGPDVKAPTLNQPPVRETPTVSPTPPTHDVKPPPAAARRAPPPESNSRPLAAPGYEYRLYHFLSVNSRGQNELGILVTNLFRDGWELHQVQIAPAAGYSTAVFRRMKRQPLVLTPGLPEPPSPDRKKDEDPRSPAERPAGMPSPLPPAPGR